MLNFHRIPCESLGFSRAANYLLFGVRHRYIKASFESLAAI